MSETALSRPRLAQATLLLASTLTIMAGATIAPALPGIERAFSNTPNASVLVGLVLTLHGLFIAIGSPAIGAIADRFGRRPLLLVSTVVYAVAGASGFVLDSLVLILAGRAVLGLAVAGVMVTTTALITDYYRDQRRETVLGRQAAFMSFGGVLLLPAAGALADVGWRVPFLVYGVSLVFLPLMAFFLPEPERTESAGDRPTSVGELRATLSRLPLGTLAVVYALALVGQILFYMVPVQAPFYLEARTGASATLVGVALGAATLTGGIVSTFYGRIRRYASVVAIVSITFAFMSVGFVIVGLSDTFLAILLGLAVVGAGVGFLLPNLNTWLAAATTDATRGRALGGLTSFFFLGQFLSPIVIRPLADIVGLGTTFLAVGGVLVFGAVGFAIAARRRTSVESESSHDHDREPDGEEGATP